MTQDVELIVSRKQLGPYYADSVPVAVDAFVGALTIQVTILPVNLQFWKIGNYFVFSSTGDDGYIIDKQNISGNIWEITMSSGLPNDQFVGDLMKVRPFIEVEERLDLYENETISQNWNFTDVGELKTVGGYSREFRIPLTERNQTIFGAISDVNYSSAQGADNFYFTRLPAEIRVNTLPIVKGHLRVMRTYKQLDKLSDIEISFYSESSDLLRIVGDKKLSDLTNLFSLNHSINKTVVTQSPFLNDFFYFLADRGQKWDETGSLNSRPISSSQTPVTLGDLTPAVKWSWIFNEILSDAGYTYDAAALLAILENYWMPWLNRQTYLNPDQFIFLAQITANQSISSGNYLSATTALVNNDGVYASDIFTTPFAGLYGFEVFTTIFLTQIPPFFNARTVEVYISDTNVLNQDYLVGTFTNNGGALETFSASFVYQYFFAAGTELRVKYKIYNGAYVELTGVPHTFVFNSLQGQGTGWRLILAQLETDGPTVFMDSLAPDVKQIDFLRDVIKMHNLAVITDRNLPTHVSFVNMNEYISGGDVKDWTSKLDISKDIVVESTTDLQKRNLLFTYTAGTDVASKAFVDGAARVYGEYRIDGYLTNQQTLANPFAIDSVEVKLSCESSPAQNIQGTNYPIQKFIDGTGNFALPKMRCLYYAGQIPVVLSDGTSLTTEDIATLNNYSNYAPTILDYDLNFAPETPLHYIVSNPYNNLFNLYWRDYLDGIYSPEARVMTAHFALDLSDVLTFQFNDQIWIKDSYWRILEIQDYKIGSTEVTQVKLLKITNYTVQCDVVPVGSLPNGQVLWEDNSGNAQTGTRTCCESYGWYWNVQKNACYSNIGTDPTGGGGSANSSVATNPNTKTFPINALKSLIDSTIDPSSSFGVYAGNQLNIGANNVGTLAVGRNIELDADKRGAIVLGKNVLAKTGGLHLGGGWITDSTSTAKGGQQFGIVMFSAKDYIAASMDTIELFIEGIANNHIELANNTLQVCTLTLNIVYDTFTGYASFQFQLQKDGAGVCTASAPILVYQESTGTASPSIVIDTTTNPDQHRLLFQAYGTGFGYNYIVVGSLQYTQLR